jgi:hypothetical protein
MRNPVSRRSTFPGSLRARLLRLLLAVGAGLVALQGYVAVSLAQTSAAEASERSVKVAFLYKFTEYVDWPAPPASAAEPFTIGVLGSMAFADELLRATADRRVNQRFIRVRRLAPNDAVDDLEVLFVAADQRGNLSDLLSPAKGRPILTVTEKEGALAAGSIINFTVSGERVRFEVSLDAAEENRLKLNSRLLAVAQSIQQSPEPP